MSHTVAMRSEHPAKLGGVRRFMTIMLLLTPLAALRGQTPASQPPAPAASAGEAVESLQRALAAELRSAQDSTHPMRYRLRKTSPRLTSTKEILETKDGAVAHLLAINDQPLSAADQQKEEGRLALLLSDPGRQRHRKQSEDADTERALRVLRVLPSAFLYQYAPHPGDTFERFTFKPNPSFKPPDLETQVLTAMTGEIWIDPAQQRVMRLEGHLGRDVDFGWGILGRLDKDGWIVIEQADIGQSQWRIVHFKMRMTGRVLFKTRTFDTVEDASRFNPVAHGIDYIQAIQLLGAGPPETHPAGQ